MSNLPTIEEIARNPSVLTSLPLDALAAISETADEHARRGSFAKKAVASVIEARFEQPIAARYAAQAKDTGTVRIQVDGYEVVADRAKKVTWDQDKLAGAVKAIRDSGDDPSEYVEISHTVTERKYGAWPGHIRAVFEPARTVKPGPTTIKLEPAKAEAA
jgi:hypothetical protein